MAEFGNQIESETFQTTEKQILKPETKKFISFKPAMLQALLDDLKTATRRNIDIDDDFEFQHIQINIFGELEAVFTRADETVYKKCKYGKVNSILLVKEEYYAFGRWIADGKTAGHKQKYSFKDLTHEMGYQYMYSENPPEDFHELRSRNPELGWYKRNPMFMPARAAREKIQLMLIEVQRCGDISELEIKFEGIQEFTKDGKVMKYGVEGWAWSTMPRSWKDAWIQLWEEVNGNWNPKKWVWALSFKRVKL